MGLYSAESVFEAWKEENEQYEGQGHRRAMLGAGFTSVGIGCFVSEGEYFWAMEFSSISSSSGANPLTLPITYQFDEDVIEFGSIQDFTMNKGETRSAAQVLLQVNYTICTVDDLQCLTSDETIISVSGNDMNAVGPGRLTMQFGIGTRGQKAEVTVLSARGYPESQHPYPLPVFMYWTYEYPTTVSYLDITFSSETKLAGSAQLLVFEDSGTSRSFKGSELSGKTVRVQGSMFTICLSSSDTENEYGFEVVNVTGDQGSFTLPSKVTVVESEAFMGVPVKKVTVPSGASVAQDAFDTGVTIERK
ncbi:MAG: hypothetical protein IJT77_01190 [Clostridia bacterium]|nr:hypothetical protein [Clostridia bacterium]